MSERLFDQLVTSGRKGRPKGGLTVPVSLAIHGAVLAAVVLVPLWWWQDLPEPATMAIHAFFVDKAPSMAPPPPPPPPAAPRAAPKAPKMEKVDKPKPVEEVPKFTAPVEVPEKVEETTTSGADQTAGDVGLPGGMEGGVTGGVEGGTPGGVEGGVVGGEVGGQVGGEIGGVPGGGGEAPAAEPSGPVRVGGQIQAPRKLKDVPPEYPAVARNAHVQGVVIIEATISPEGRVSNVKVLRGAPLLDASALAAVRQWVYSPTLLNGTPVAVIMTVTVNFRLSGNS